MNKSLFIALTAYFLSCFNVFSQTLTLQDITKGKYSTSGVYGVNPLLSGDTYSQLVDSKRIVVSSFRTGSQVSVLFDVDNTKGKTHLDAIDGYIMSPDEKNILLRTKTQSIYRRSSTAVYYIYNVNNRTLQPLSDGGPQECPRWSRDGNMVGFVREGNLFLVRILFGFAETQVTKDGEFNRIINGKADWVNEEEFLENGTFDFNSDGTMMAWIRYDETDVIPYSFPMYKGMKPEMTQYDTHIGTYEYKYPLAGCDNSRVSVQTYDIKSRNIRTMKLQMDADGYIPRIRFSSNDAEKLLIITQNRHQDRLEVHVCNPRSTECRMIVRDEVKPYIGETAYTFFDTTPGGFLLMSERSGYAHVYLYDMVGTLKREFGTGSDIITNFYGYDSTTGNAYYAAIDGSPLRTGIFRCDSKGRVTRLSTEQGQNTAIFSKSWRYMMLTHHNTQTPPVYTLRETGGKVLTTLEDNSKLRQKLQGTYQGQGEFFTFTTSQGVELNGWMLRPSDFDPAKKYPVIMFQYGGPGSQQVLDSWNIGNCGGHMLENYFAQNGFISVIVDGRGTGGRGAAFEKQTYLHLGRMEAEDQVEAAIWLGSQPYIDKEHIGIWGWSFGGFNTIMSMSEGRPVFYAGVAVAPPTCFRFYDTIYTERFMRTPKENPDGYGDNAITRASKLSGSLLICHGLADDNVHFRNTAEYTEALVQADKDFRMLTYTNRNHFISGGNTRNHLYRQILNHFKSNL